MAPPPDPPSAIALRIKVPPGHIPGGADEFRLGDGIAVTTKIGQIRERIQESIPSSPTPERQRLLYGGRALVDNDQSLADALNIRRDPTQTEYVVHLLVKGDGANSAPVPHLRANTPAASATPTTNGAPQPGQPQTPGQQQVHPNHQDQTLEQLQATAFAQQQRIHQQLLQQAYQQRPPIAGAPPFGMHPMHLGGQMPGPQPNFQPGPPPQNIAPARPGSTPASVDTAPIQSAPQSQPANVQSTGEQAQPQPNVGQPQQPPARPVSNQGFHMEGVGPNGQRIMIHQQTLNIPHAAFHGPGGLHHHHHHHPPGPVPPQMAGAGQFPPQMPFGLPPFAGLPMHNPPRPNGPSALDRARENVAEMRRMIDELRASSATSETQRQQISELETRTQALNDYIDPFHLGNIGNNRPRTNAPQAAGTGNVPAGQVPPPARGAPTADLSWQQRARQLRQQQQGPNPNTSEVTCYLLSSPTGPHAILYSPQHGAYTGSLPYQSQGLPSSLQPTPTIAVQPDTFNGANNAQQNQVAVQGQADAAQQAQQQPQAAQDPLAPVAMGVMFNHMWLLLRILIFSYFLLGANLGWRRPLALLAIGIGFWLIRTGLLGDGGAVRRWWDGIMNEGRPAAQNQQNNQAADQQQQGNQQAPGENGGAGRMPTPEELARRLLDEDARVRNARFQTIRDRIRPVERAVALLVASLWPGVGERIVRAREEEERRRAEEEVAARRREEEARQQQEEEAKKNQAGGTGKSGEKADSEPVDAQTPSALPESQTAAASAEAVEKSNSG